MLTLSATHKKISSIFCISKLCSIKVRNHAVSVSLPTVAPLLYTLDTRHGIGGIRCSLTIVARLFRLSMHQLARFVHREYAAWTPQQLISWAAAAGKATATVVGTILLRKVHPEHAFNSCLGVISLGLV
jgi:hypothetical protein